jgi:hypothetical protein
MKSSVSLVSLDSPYLQTSHLDMQQTSCFIQRVAEMAKAMMAREPDVEPNCKAKRAGSVPITMCVSYTPMIAAIAERRRSTQRIHLVTIQPVEQVLPFLCMNAMEKERKGWEVEVIVAGKISRLHAQIRVL